jgi:rSAM/selenodomain-associated transferase 2
MAGMTTAADWSVVVPVLNEAGELGGLLAGLADAGEVWVVDGGSDDGSRTIARLMGAHVVSGVRGRGIQLQRGAAEASRPFLLLLHGDVRLPEDWAAQLAAALEQPGVVAAAFRLRVRGPGWRLRLLERLVDLRSGWGQRPYGDQGLALQRSTYLAVGGVRPLPLMEDLELVERLARHGRLALVPAAVQVSDRRWRALGVWRTAWRNARLRRAWRRGEDPQRLAELYALQALNADDDRP